jgi:hypothetical protein
MFVVLHTLQLILIVAFFVSVLLHVAGHNAKSHRGECGVSTLVPTARPTPAGALKHRWTIPIGTAQRPKCSRGPCRSLGTVMTARQVGLTPSPPCWTSTCLQLHTLSPSNGVARKETSMVGHVRGSPFHLLGCALLIICAACLRFVWRLREGGEVVRACSSIDNWGCMLVPPGTPPGEPCSASLVTSL